MKAFSGALTYAALSLAAAAAYGVLSGANVLGCVWVCAVLAILEVSLSFDNAVVNAQILKDMPTLWAERFISWGMPIAVIGMRLVVPIVIIALAGHMNPIAALTLALEHPTRYAAIISAAHTQIMGFGGAFLMLVGLKFFFDEEKDTHWLGAAERVLQACGRLEAFEIVATLLTLAGISTTLPHASASAFLASGAIGIASFFAIEWIGTMLQAEGEARHVQRVGAASFIYLEMLDASCSFDGVIGAFAVSTNLVLIALGLGIGAMFVRTMTLELVRRRTLTQYCYLEHGAFWAILSLAILMLASVRLNVPDILTGLLGASFIGAAFVSSLHHNALTEDTTLVSNAH